MIKAALVVVLLLAACRRETPAPATSTQPVAPEPSAVATAAGPRPMTQTMTTSYADAVVWFRSTPGFHFVVDEGGVHAEGDMTRSRVGAETIAVTVNGEQWTAESSKKGIVWRRGGKEADAPTWGNRLYQRVTIAFDPEKREGHPQFVEPGHFRFTDANSGAVHDVWIDAEGKFSKMTIGNAVTMTITKPQ